MSSRFALCERRWRRFIGFRGYEADPSLWQEEAEWCAIDLVRGYKSPYWGYYGDPSLFVKNRIKPLLEANTVSKLVQRISCDWNFFSVCQEDLEKPFCILSYDVNQDGNSIIITGRSEYKTFEEHKDALKQEIEKNLVDK